MLSVQAPQKNTCSLLAVLCGKVTDFEHKQYFYEDEDRRTYPFPELVSSGHLEVHTLIDPTIEEFRQVLESVEPNIVYLQGEQLQNDEIGSLVWRDVGLFTMEAICGLFCSVLPDTVYLELPNGEELAEALQQKGVPYVIYWKGAFSCYAACHFRHSLLSVIQSSCAHTWDAFQLAHASFTLHCVQNNHVMPANSQQVSGKSGPRLFGDAPKINIYPMEKDVDEEIDELSGTGPAIKIYDADVSMKFLLCGISCALDACLLRSLEDGLNALLNIEIRGSKLHNRASAPPPPLQAGAFSRGVVTMRCEFTTSSCSHISLLVSGSAQTCFDDQLLESHIKNELLESQLVHTFPVHDESNKSFSAPRTSVSIACGATVYEVCMKVPTWALQVLRQLAPETSYHNFASLGIACIQGSSVASFDKDDTERLLFFCTRQGRDLHLQNPFLNSPPSWLKPPNPCREGSVPHPEIKTDMHSILDEGKTCAAEICQNNGNEPGPLDSLDIPFVAVRKKLKVAAMRPIPRVNHRKMLLFPVISETDGYFGGQGKANLSAPLAPKHKHVGSAPVTQRKSLSRAYQAQQIISLNPLPLKKHGCGRCPIQICSEEEFLRDLMQFLVLRGHTRLVPQGGLAEFPDAILNTKRLDLYNLYREVVSRGGFHVGNGINWKGQVFSKMRNHTVTNKMTGVGNTLKRHYETYLLEYELAHDDVDGECCLLCHSSAAGDWVNCGICGEWAHFGCDRRQGLGAFKDYAKTDGLEYICPHCSITNFSRKPPKFANGHPQASNGLRPL